MRLWTVVRKCPRPPKGPIPSKWQKIYPLLDTGRGVHYRHGGEDVYRGGAGDRVRHAGVGAVRCGADAAAIEEKRWKSLQTQGF